MPNRRRITLMMDLVGSYGRGIYTGITKYARLIGNWELWTQPSTVWGSRDHPWEWDVSGAILLGPITPAVADACKRGLPIVNLTGPAELPLPLMQVDHRAIGQLAANHLLERGLKSFGFVGWEDGYVSQERLKGFRERLDGEYPVTCYDYPVTPLPDKPVWPDPGLVAWITAAQKPLGVFASNDELASCVADAARSAALAVPEQAAIIGVDNDECIQQRCPIPLTSIELPAARFGYEAAALLDQLMHGEKVRPRPAADFQPVQVVSRQSTELLAVDDPDVARAMRYIRDRALTRVSMQEVANAVALSTRSMELRFRKEIGQSPGEFLIRTRIQQAQRLLLETDLKMSVIAKRSAFCSMSHFGSIFRQYVGMTPTAYRENRRIT